MKEYNGVLEAYFETGCEGFIWALMADGEQDFFEALKLIEKGDHLTVYGEHNEILFEGYIDPDWEIGWREYPYNPGNGQPTALGYWIHWTQKGWQPDDWAKLFFHAYIKRGNKPLRAKLIKK